MTQETPNDGGAARDSTFEDLRVEGTQLLSKVRDLIQEGNVRRIIVRDNEGRTLIEIPLTLGVAGAVLAPALAAVGAVAALVTECSIPVERAQPESS